MPHKKNHSPFDISNMFPSDNKGFGFTIDSSFVHGSSQRQKSQSKKMKKFVKERFRMIQTGSTEPSSPYEKEYGEEGKNIYGQRII